MEMSGQQHTSAALPPGKEPGTYWIVGWLDLRAGLEVLEEENLLSLPENVRP